MAPNRKQLAVALDPLVSTQPLVQAKYLPLTAEATSSIPLPSPEPTIIRSNNVDYDYWAWESPSAAPVVDLFSADHIEANLAKESARIANSNSTIITAQQQSSDDYWAERIEARYSSEENIAISNTTGYWEWPQDEEQVTALQIALILKEEFARQQTSGSHMEERLQQDATITTHYQQERAVPENDDYWNWESPTTVRAEPNEVSESYWEWDAAVVSEQTLQEQMIENILAYEKARSLLSAEHMEEQLLLLQKNINKSAATTISSSNTTTDAYWNWPAQEDDYWNMRPMPAAVVAEAPFKGYWDW